MGTSTVPSLQLELPKFESLTAGTSLPQVAPEDIEDPPPAPPPSEAPTPAAAAAADDNQSPEDPVSPPQSPGGRPTSMRRFLSRVSLNSSYTTNTAHHNHNHKHGTNETTDKASILSTPTLSSPEPKKSKKSSWWKKASGSSKRHSMMPATPSHPNQMKVQAIPPPPRLPDNMFGSNMSSMDGDMFKNFK